MRVATAGLRSISPRIRSIRHLFFDAGVGRGGHVVRYGAGAVTCGLRHQWLNTQAQQKEKGTVDAETVTVSEDDEDKQAKKQDAAKNRETFSRIVKLALPESRLIGASMASLVVTSSISLVFPAAIGKILDISLADSTGMSPTYLAGGLMGLFIVQGGFIVGRSAMLSVASERLIARFRKQLFRSILAQDMAFFDATRTGELVNRLSVDTQLVQKSVTGNAVNGLRNVFMAVGGTGMLFYTSPWLALVSLSIIPPVGLMARKFGREVKQRQVEVQDALADTSTVAEEVIANMRTVRQFAGEPTEAAKYDARIDTAFQKAALVGLTTAWFEGSVHLAANFSLVAVLGYGGALVMSHDITAGALTSFLMYSLYVGFNITSLSTVYSDLMRGIGASARIFDIIDRVPSMPSSITSACDCNKSISDASADPNRLPASVLAHIHAQVYGPGVMKSQPHGASLFGLTPPSMGEDATIPPYETPYGTRVTAVSGFDTLAQEVQGTLQTPEIMGKVEFRDVAFSYPMRPTIKILDGLNLNVKQGKSMAVVGSSGSGKSTIVALLTRLYDPQQGAVLLDGVDVRNIDPHWMRRHVGVVQQEAQLFSGTIEENIRYGALADQASFEDVVTAATQANAHEFVQRLPEGYQTIVGERGLTLSGGQKQRVAIARALLSKPKLLLLDEATSALDTASESQVQDALEKIMVGKQSGGEDRQVSSVVIAHRLSTVRNCDSIAVLDAGKVVQQGTHAELMRVHDGIYASLVSKQLKP